MGKYVHIYLLRGAHPTTAAEENARIFKSVNSREVFAGRPGIKKNHGVDNSGRTGIMQQPLENEKTGAG